MNNFTTRSLVVSYHRLSLLTPPKQFFGLLNRQPLTLVRCSQQRAVHFRLLSTVKPPTEQGRDKQKKQRVGSASKPLDHHHQAHIVRTRIKLTSSGTMSHEPLQTSSRMEPSEKRMGNGDRRGQNSKANGAGIGRRRERGAFLFIEPKYSEYWSREDIDRGVAEGRVVLGAYHLIPNKRNIGFVRLTNGLRDVYIDGAEARNRAMDGDYVAVELDPEDANSQSVPVEVVRTPNVRKLELARPDLEAEAKDALWCPTESTVPQPASDTAEKSEGPSVVQKQRTGKIVSVLAVNTGAPMNADREFVAQHIGKLEAACPIKILKPGHHLPATETFAYFVPTDARIPKIRIPRGELPYEFTQDPLIHGQNFLYAGKITTWPASQRDPIGILLGRIGQAGEIGTETHALLVENDVDHGEFPQPALDCLQKFLPPRTNTVDQPDETWWKIPKEEFSKRLDLRNTLIYTVDPYTAKDIDDAVHCTPLPNGDFEVGVHIADVSYFVERGSALDEEAHRRSTTVYLVQKVIPMLPALLSEELCSLNPNVDRLAFSCIWRMRPNGELVPNHPVWYGRTIIRSACKLHYGLAQRIIDGGPSIEDWDEPGRVPEHSKWTKEQVCESLRNMHVIGMARRKLRFDPQRGGALEMQTVKMSFALDQETGNPVGVQQYPLHDTNRLIEEFMLLANFLVAQKLIAGDRENAFLRHHPPPDAKEMQKIVEVLQRSCGVTLFENGKISPSAIHEALKTLKGSTARRGGEEAIQQSADNSALKENNLLIVASELLKKPMKNAQYFVASDMEEFNWRHWALNIKYYTHFTSPIRRYADVCVHRMLTRVLEGGESMHSLSPQEKIFLRAAAERCNEKKDASRQAQEASDELYLNLLIRDLYAKHTPLSTSGIVVDLGPKSFTVLMPGLGITKRVHVIDDLHWTVLSSEILGGNGNGGQQRSTEDAASDDKQKSKPKKDGQGGTVISLRARDPKSGNVMEIKVLSEFPLSLIPRQSSAQRDGGKERRGGGRDDRGNQKGPREGAMDFKLVLEKDAPLNGVTIVEISSRSAKATSGHPHHHARHHDRPLSEQTLQAAANSYRAPKYRLHGKGSGRKHSDDGDVTAAAQSAQSAFLQTGASAQNVEGKKPAGPKHYPGQATKQFRSNKMPPGNEAGQSGQTTHQAHAHRHSTAKQQSHAATTQEDESVSKLVRHTQRLTVQDDVAGNKSGPKAHNQAKPRHPPRKEGVSKEHSGQDVLPDLSDTPQQPGSHASRSRLHRHPVQLPETQKHQEHGQDKHGSHKTDEDSDVLAGGPPRRRSQNTRPRSGPKHGASNEKDEK